MPPPPLCPFPVQVFFILEAIAIVIFTIEYLGRLLTVAYVPEDGDKAADGPGSTHNDRNAEMSSTRALAPPADHRDSAESAAGSRGHTKTVSDMPQDVNPIASLSSGRPGKCAGDNMSLDHSHPPYAFVHESHTNGCAYSSFLV